VNAVDNGGCTPLFWAVYAGRPECATVLLAAGAAVNHRDTNGRTPLDYALAQYEEDDESTAAARAEVAVLLEAAGGLEEADLSDDDDDDNEDDSDDEDA